ncbi:hypothetical protein DXX93_05685 [Thalassotalea euphylliae]|uniref:Uncharacterized protein n=1 Tax=Thalassotalea euphylliae TaxID=1655234 RepID=A0A3E0TP41_9GAMM|nr:oligosaccharide flippase family protein [Thalassotalea euphylliae]REL26117.1 hypothetical protein DXX93_05685 [Thalassotalea euphylliae]
MIGKILPYLQRNQELLKGSSIILALKIFFTIVGFFTSVVITRYLSIDEAGSVFFAIALVTLLSTFSRFGLDQAIVKTFAKLRRKANGELLLTGICRQSIHYALIGAGAIAVFLSLLTLVARNYNLLSDGYYTVLLVCALSIPLYSLISLCSAFHQGLKHSFSLAMVNGFPSVVFLACILCLFFINQLTLINLLLLFCFSHFVVLSHQWFYWKQKLSWDATSSEQQLDETSVAVNKDFKQLLPSMWGIACLGIIMMQGAQIIVGLLSNEVEVALFSVANRVALVLAFLLLSLNGVLSPKFAELSDVADRQMLKQTYRESTLLLNLMTLPLILVCFVFAEQILLIFGESYQQASSVLRVLLIAQLAKVVFGSVGQLLVMTGNSKIQRKNITLAVVTLVVFCLALVPHYGAFGAAFATLIAVTLNNALGYYSVRNKLNISLF